MEIENSLMAGMSGEIAGKTTGKRKPVSKKVGPGRPLRGEKKRIRTSFTLPPEQVEWLREQAQVIGKSNSEVLETILENAQGGKQANGKTSRLGKKSKIKIDVPFSSVDDCCRRHSIIRLSLFGSVLKRGYDPEKNNLDVLVEFMNGYAPSLFDILRLENELGTIFNVKRIDLKRLNELSLYLRDEVRKKAELIYDINRDS